MNETEKPVNDHTDERTPPGEQLGDISRRLREARQSRGESIDDVVRELKLRRIYLQALEDGDWQTLPDEVYAIGFLKQYAAHLGIDIGEDIRQLRNSQYRLTRPLTFPDPPVAPSRRWAWIAGGCFLLFFIAFNIFNSGDEPDVSPVRPETAPAPQPAAIAIPAAPAEKDIIDDAPEPAASPDPAPDAVSDATPPPASGTAPVEAPAPQAILPLHHYRFDAVDDEVWLQIFLPAGDGQKKGELRKEMLLRAGHHLGLNEAVDRLWLTTGNAGALQISIDGNIEHPAGSLGPRGKVLRDLVVRADD